MPRIGGRFLGVRVSYRGRVRAYAGPKSLRVSAGKGRTSVSSSAGPFTHFWTDSNGKRRRSYDPSRDYNAYYADRRTIMASILELHRQGLTSKEIADRMMERGIRTPTGGFTWRASSVTRMLRTDGFEPNTSVSRAGHRTDASPASTSSISGYAPPSALRYRRLDNSKPVKEFIIELYKEGRCYAEIAEGLRYADYRHKDRSRWTPKQVERVVVNWRSKNRPSKQQSLAEWLEG